MTMLRVVPYDRSRDRAWRRFLDESTNGTIFHDLRFLAYHREREWSDHHLLFYDGEEVVALLPGGLVPGEPPRYVSPCGASFGGFVVRGQPPARLATALVRTLIEHVRGEGAGAIEISPSPPVYQASPGHAIEFALSAAGFRRQVRALTHVVTLGGVNNLGETFVSSARRAARRAGRLGVKVESSEDYRKFYDLLWADRQALGAEPTHSLEDLMRLRELVPEALHLFLAKAKRELVGGTLLFVCNRRVVLNFYLCRKRERQDLRMSNLLASQTIDWASREGFLYYDFGTSTIDMEPNWGLVRFKEGFGATPYLREHWKLELG
ncbi:hypothetical protein AMJ71_02475 [candidate division TA06 bacterium SM1_40]|uniref:BioF2-like acetyltransferase domain-containing protein n=3 Tax=Bacteria division TA06 TaxID=1156500 RepID=A0A0S8JLK9_UNCT6|nr:MAG: hypothetical protein AMJ71_02475 [candidate division TA06 bacterium SM1_40]